MDKVGLVLGREARDNTQRVRNAIYWTQFKQRSMVLLSTAAEKAFYRIIMDFFILIPVAHWVGTKHDSLEQRPIFKSYSQSPS